MEKVLVVLSFVDHLFVLELVGYVIGVLPMVLMAPESIMSEMMMALKLEVISLINLLFIFIFTNHTTIGRFCMIKQTKGN